MKKLLRRFLLKLKSWYEAYGKTHVRKQLTELQKLPFFHSIYFGATAHACPGWKSTDGLFHSDAPIAIVVTRGGTISGVVGFEIVGSTILIRQMQGAPKGNFNGVRVEEYVLRCAEQIAEALKMKVMRIVTAETAIHFRETAPQQDRPSDVAKIHMQKIYSFPAKAGYHISYFWRLRRMTFIRQLS